MLLESQTASASSRLGCNLCPAPLMGAPEGKEWTHASYRGLETCPRSCPAPPQAPPPRGTVPPAEAGQHWSFPLTPPQPHRAWEVSVKSRAQGLTVQKKPVQPESGRASEPSRCAEGAWLDGAGQGSGSSPPSEWV